MKNLFKTTLAGLVLALSAGVATAQTPYGTTGNSPASAGSTNLTVNVEKSGDLRASSNASGANNGAVLTGMSNNNALDVNLTFNDITPNNTAVGTTGSQRFSSAIIPIRVRSNAPYLVKAYLEGTGANVIPSGAGNSGDFKTGDIGFGMNDQSAPGSNALLAPGGTLSVVSPFQNAPANANVVNGQPQYATTLNNIGTGAANATTVASGNRISLRGDNSSDNWRSVRMRFAIKPQYYTNSATPLTETFRVFIVVP